MIEIIYLQLSKFYKNKNREKSIKYFNKYFNKILELINLKNKFFKEKNIKKAITIFNKIQKPQIYEYTRSFLLNKKVILPDFIFLYYKKILKHNKLNNKILFIFNYNCGLGDFIMYCRYILIIEKQAKKVIIEVPENLFDLYKYNFQNCDIILSNGEEYKGKYDYTCHHELFLNLQKDLKKFPNYEGYLKADTRLIKQFETLFKNKKNKVGLFWQSNSNSDNIRSICTNEIIPILKNSNIQFYSLAKESKDIPLQIVDLSPYIKNAHDTAAIMKNLDLVISIDSFPIHLAGALGIKAFLMLPFDSDWRWFNETEKTAWYNSVTIFKQTKPGDWSDVVQRVSLALEQFLNENYEPEFIN